MRQIVLDTNCLLQVLPSRSPYHKVWEEILAGKIALCVNTDILNEYEEILSAKTSNIIARNVVEAIARLHTTVFQDVYYHFGLIEEDPDDNKFVDCAVAADVEFIVTNDRHFAVLKDIDWPRVSVVKLTTFVSSIAAN